MIRSAAGKVMWVGRTTAAVIGLAIALALVLGVATMALAAVPGDPFKLGKVNSIDRISILVGTATSPMLKVENKGTGTALNLKVQDGKPPMTVTSDGRVPKLNSDMVDGKHASAFLPKSGKAADSAKLDGKEASSFANATHQHSGEAITSGTVEAERIEDGPGSGLNADELDGVDSTQFAQKLDSGMTTFDPISIAAQSCNHLVIDPPGAGDISNDVVVVTPNSVAANLNLVFGTARASQNPNAFRIRFCNITADPIDPPSATYYWMIFHQP